MEDYDVRSAASILASVKEQEARFEQLTRALEEERRNVTLQLERANMPPNTPNSQPLAWQQVVLQVNHVAYSRCPVSVRFTKLTFCFLLPSKWAHVIVFAHPFYLWRDSFLCDVGNVPVSVPAALNAILAGDESKGKMMRSNLRSITLYLHCLPLNPIFFCPQLSYSVHGSSDWMWPFVQLRLAMGRV